ncbi:MAG: hypothetical protein ACFFE5_15255 [Candidatus Thorarchaeota archaeon]
MDETEKENLFATIKAVIESIFWDKRNNPKNIKMLDEFQARLNIGLHVESDFYLWVNLVAKNGKNTINEGKLEDFDLEIMATPEDLLFFSNGENSILNMMLKKNKFGERKLKFDKSSTGKRNLGLLLKLPKILVLDKIKTH